MSRKLFASESVTEGHPDKICDQISDAVLDAILKEDREARVAIEVLVTNGLVVVAGEVTTETYVDIQQLVRNKIIEIGFDNSAKGFDGNTCGVLVSLGAQSSEIAKGVDIPLESRLSAQTMSLGLGAGDQGLMFGYATDENPDYMPTPINLAHLMTKRLAELRKSDSNFEWLYPDGKSQVIIGYEDNKPVSVEHVLISTQHSPLVNLEFVQEQVVEHVINHVISEYNNRLLEAGLPILDFKYATLLVNPAGEWNVGGPKADAGLTGRKIIVDTYGGFARHGGGNFQGKDPSKVDRSAAYALRWVAKNLIAAGLAERVELQVSYAIGKVEPLGLYVDTFGTSKFGLSDEDILGIVNQVFDLRPSAIIDSLGLKDINNYQEVAKYGHFGINSIELGMPWERLDKVEEIISTLK
jgi:S-adenosylmethionine synthetase